MRKIIQSLRKFSILFQWSLMLNVVLNMVNTYIEI